MKKKVLIIGIFIIFILQKQKNYVTAQGVLQTLFDCKKYINYDDNRQKIV